MPPTLYISPGTTENLSYMYNPAPVYGLFESDRVHPLALSIFSNHVPLLFATTPRKKKTQALICSDKHPSPPKHALICKFQKSSVPQPIPPEVWEYLRNKQVKLPAQHKEAPFSSVPIGFGQSVSNAFENESYDPLGDLGIEAVYYVIIPYASEVLRLIKSPDELYAEKSPLPADYGFSYVCPWKLPAFYSSLEDEPTPEQVRDACYKIFPGCDLFAEQVSAISIAVSLVALNAKETIERRAGRGLLAIGDRIIFFRHVYSSNATQVKFGDLHNIVQSREPLSPFPIPPVCKIEKLIVARFYYSAQNTRAVGERVLAYVALDVGGGWKEMVLDLPSFLYALFPSEAYVIAIRKSLNYRSALEAGEEGWEIQLSGEPFYQFSLPADEISALLKQIVDARERRAYTK